MVKPVVSKSVRRREKAKKLKILQQNACNRMLWKLIAYTGVPMRISIAELEDIPDNAGVKVDFDKGNMVFTALNIPGKSNIILPAEVIKNAN